MDETVIAHVRQGSRLMQIVGWGPPLLLYVGLLVAIFFDWLSWLPASVIMLSVCFFWFVPFLRVDVGYRLLTDHSPAQTRDEIQSVDNPLAIWYYALADEDGVEIHENGATYETSVLFGLRTVRIRCETEQGPNGDLLVRMWKNGVEAPVATVSIEPADGTGSVVTVDGFTLRLSLRRLLMLWVRQIPLTAAYKAFGYKSIDNETQVSLR